jgi:hypothetical protein
MDHETVTGRRLAPHFPSFDPGVCPEIFPHYDRAGDHLRISFKASPAPAYSLPVMDYVAFRVDLDSGEIVGMEIERFLARAIAKHPELTPLVAFAQTPRRSLFARLRWKSIRKPEREQVGAIVKQFSPQLSLQLT